MIDTSKVQDRRKLRYQSFDDMLKDVDRVVAAAKAGKLRCTGNWTAGQTFNHLATWINYGWDGYPMKVPWFIRPLIRRKMEKYLTGGMDAGVHIPGAEGGTYGTDAMGTDEAAAKLRKSVERMRREPPKFDSPAFGKMTDEQRTGLALRHAELHMSFLHP